MVEETDYGRGFKDGIKDTTRRIDEALNSGKRIERERLTKIIDNFCFGDTEESIEVKRELNELFAILGDKE